MLRHKTCLAAVLLALLTALPIWGHGDGPGVDEGSVVLAVPTFDKALVSELALRYDLWTWNPRNGEALVRVEARRVGELAGLGARVDEARTLALQLGPVVPADQIAGIPGFPCYRTVEETYTALSNLATAHPTLASWQDFGDSWEKINGPGSGYDLRVLVLTNSERPGPKFPFVLMAAIHARELTTAELATRFAEQLVNGYGVDPDATWLLDYGELHIVPLMNPDGRKKAEAGLLWRKNTNNGACSGSNSRGIDLNRNSGFFWGGATSSSDPCSDLYRGSAAASEPETAAIEAYIAQVFEDQRGPNQADAAPDTATGLFLSLHSFGGYNLYPWEGLDGTAAPNRTGLEGMAKRMSFYNSHLACEDALYPAGGTTVDKAYGEYGVAGFTVELGDDFFESCSNAEANVLPGNLNMLRFVAKAARRPYLEPRGPEIHTASLSAVAVEAGTPVTLTATADDTRARTGGSCSNNTAQPIALASYSIDVPPWLAASPTALAATDGSYSSTTEAVNGTIDTSALAVGKHLVYVFADDTAGSRGVPTALFLEITGNPAIFADDFESGSTAAWGLTVP